MPTIDITETELQLAAQGARIGAAQAEQDAAKQSNPDVHATFAASARRFRELAAKLEDVRTSGVD